MLEAIDIRKYLAEYGSSVNEDGSRILESVSCGGESGPKARTCDYGWVLNTHIQCVEYGVPFHFHQTGARLRRSVPDGHGGHILKIYEIPREYQHTQAEKAGLDYGGGIEILTLVTNILGAILIGFIVGITDKKADVSPNTVLFWKTGVCGGFTTFSTFSLEANKLFENKACALRGVYVILSVCCCVFGIFIGKKLATITG